MSFFKQYRYPLGITLSLIGVLFVFQNATCSPPSAGPSRQTITTLDYGQGQLSVSAAKNQLTLNETTQLQVQGGTPPYTFFVLSGGGDVSGNGAYTAPANETTAQVEVVDAPRTSVGVVNVVVSTGTTTPAPSVKYSSLQWQSTGASQLTFSIARSGSAFAITVTSRQSQSISQTVSLTKSSNSSLYDFVDGVFEGKTQILSDGSPGSDGNWSTLVLEHSNGSEQFTSPVTNGSTQQFDDLYQYVISNLD